MPAFSESDHERVSPKGPSGGGRQTADPRTDPGTEGPGGFLDDQPQREDEYLSSLLNDFNPQRRGRNDVPPDSSGR